MTRIVQATRERSRRWLALPVVAAVLVTLVVVQGAASQPSTTAVTTCGQSVKGNVVVANDLLNCPNDGIDVNADGTTIDLKGHTITYGGPPSSGAIGVYALHFKSVVVKNGTVSGFNNDVEFDTFSSGTVQGVRVSGSGSGISVGGNEVITGNTAFGNGTGIFAFGGDASKVTVTNNVAYGNTGIGIAVNAGVGTVVTGNRAVSNGGYGIYVNAAGATATGNTADSNGDDGIYVGTPPTLMPSPPDKVSANKAYFNDELGIKLGSGDLDLGGNRAGGNHDAHQCANVVCSPAVAGKSVLASDKPTRPAGGLVTVVTTCGQTVHGSVTLANDLVNCPGDGIDVDGDGTTIDLNGHELGGQLTPVAGTVGVNAGGHSSVVVKNGAVLFFETGLRWGADSSGAAQGLRVFANSADGILSDGKVTIVGDVSNGNGRFGIRIEPDGSGVVSGNRALSNGSDGFFINTRASVVVTGNTSNGNAGHGFWLWPSANPNPGDVTLTPIQASSNKAYWNTDLGIDAGPGVTDSGKNAAGGNGTKHQCENVTCSPVAGASLFSMGAQPQTSASGPPRHPTGSLTTITACGQSASGSVTLTIDLTNCPGDGIDVSADGTTINLNGHTISGTVPPTGGTAGVNAGNHKSVVVKNGRITGFHEGVEFTAGATSSTVQGVNAFGNSDCGIDFEGGVASKATITSNVANANANCGIWVQPAGPGTVVSGNRATSNSGSSDGIDVGATGATVTNNIANANGEYGLWIDSPDSGATNPIPLKASGNQAYWNDKLGIKFGGGDADLGKNAAGGNGDKHQCEDIVCSPAVAGAPLLFGVALSQPSTHSRAASSALAGTPPPYHCGETVSGSVTLNASLSGCGAAGLVVGASGTTINLNGNTISGTDGVSSKGIQNVGNTSVVVKNGTISDFGDGVFETGSGTVQGVRLFDNARYGIHAQAPMTITGNTVFGNLQGGIVHIGASPTKLTIMNNGVNGNTGDGIHLDENTAGSLISGNRALSNTGNGIVVASGATVANNIANGNGNDGMDLSSSDPTALLKASGNKAYFNTLLGFDVAAGGLDLGTNVAGGNGSTHQCENIVCSSAVAGSVSLFGLALPQPSTHAASAAQAGTPPPYRCGEPVSGSVTLNTNLTCSDTNGLVVNTDGTTINLNGHTISGTPTGTVSDYFGVLNPGHSHVVVKNGTISGFYTEVELGSAGGTVQGLRLEGAVEFGVGTGGPALITGNTAFGNQFGIYAEDSGTPYKVTITNNVSTGNSEDGIHLEHAAAGSVVSGNRVLSNRNSGIFSNAPGATFSGNTVDANDFGMHVFSDDAMKPIKVTGNKAHFNTLLGIQINPSDIDGGGNLAGGNGSAHQCEDVACA
jgi:parallel beta-helix repeat protein